MMDLSMIDEIQEAMDTAQVTEEGLQSLGDIKAHEMKKHVMKKNGDEDSGEKLEGVVTKASSPTVKISITASHDGGNIELISISEPVVSSGGRTAKCIVTVHVKPGEYASHYRDFHSY